MTDELSQTAPVIKQKSRISPIWILPIIALIIGVGMFYQEWQDRGQMIEIAFENANGLEEKKTKVKFKNVNIGTLESIEFNEQGDGIIAKVIIDREMTRFLRSDSVFWVVRPRIGSDGVSGVSTLLSGAYISMEAGISDSISLNFVGLESPPVASPNDEGLRLSLISTGGKMLRVGNPILYRGFEVGAVQAIDFDIESRELSYDIFINAPYHNLITSNTFFWNVSGFGFTTGPQGVSVDFSSLETFISGGVEFDVPEDLGLGERVTESRSFKLYPNKTSVTEDRKYEYLEYVLLVEDSVAGLQVGTPVEYRGIRIGRVAKPYLGFHQTNQIDPEEERIPVVIHIEPRRLTEESSYSLDWFDKQFQHWIKTGLGANIESANYLTGAMKVTLDMSNEASGNIEYFGDYTIIPIGDSSFAGILEKTDRLLAKLNALDIESIIESTKQTMQSADRTLGAANDAILSTQSVIQSVNDTMIDAQEALKGISPDSTLYKELQLNLIQMQKTMDDLQPFIQRISEKPNLLIFSEQPQADEQPEGKAR
uniref:intermembrane transport protein PqiB n=1 Tax=Ningiella ruwaisensis TaxID=2364274 RepID=UPI00109F45BB|nr:intermembrane transport protein PqiB [Ningiella ruwaisensis]